ncbi:MAG: hypothetical protein HN368_03885, partial [Spirochaetales bacterium]|nr:hypothetical protein [Spirochaetales bacterium]
EKTPAARRGVLFGIQTMVPSIGWFAAPLVGSALSIRYSTMHVFLSMSIFLGVTFVYTLFVKKIVSRRG